MANRGRKSADSVLIVALAAGRTVGEAAEEAGVSPRTVHRRLDDPEFRQQLSKASVLFPEIFAHFGC